MGSSDIQNIWDALRGDMAEVEKEYYFYCEVHKEYMMVK
jgi:hypothetical protein